MNKYEREFKIAELIAESEEQRRFDEFYEKIQNLIIRHKTQEPHLPLMFILTNDASIDYVRTELRKQRGLLEEKEK